MWNGFKSEEFDFRGRKSVMVFPEDKNSNGKLLYKTEYWNAFPELEIELVKNGYHLCHMDHGDKRWGAPSEVEWMADFVRFVAERYALMCKCIPVGMSAGGLQGANLAIKHPEMIDGLYLDAPALNILSLAGLGARARNEEFYSWLLREYDLDESGLVIFRDSPIDHLDVLIKNRIPAVLVYGGRDDVVIYRENGEVLEKEYRKNGIPIKVVCKPECGHHPHGVENKGEIISFIKKYM